eukprot:m.145768 g.145768  ORF g.145768 m.145768 type:complete len:429 (-) comp16791_c0_seq1:212-1498(-)
MAALQLYLCGARALASQLWSDALAALQQRTADNVVVDVAGGLADAAAPACSAIVTGGCSGVGLETARALACVHKMHVVLAGRDEVSGMRAVEAIRAGCPSASVEWLHLDLASPSSIAAFVAAYAHVREGARKGRGDRTRPPLRILVNNAGVMLHPYAVTEEEGLELHHAVNFLGHARLVELLLPLLRAQQALTLSPSSSSFSSSSSSAAAASPAVRIVCVSSVVHEVVSAIDWSYLSSCHPSPQTPKASSLSENSASQPEPARYSLRRKRQPPSAEPDHPQQADQGTVTAAGCQAATNAAAVDARTYSAHFAYAQSKLFVLLYARALARRLKAENIAVFAVHPGIVNTPLYRHVHPVLRLMQVPLAAVAFRSAVAGAASSLYAACSPELSLEDSGAYIANSQVAASSALADDVALQDAVKDLALTFCR